MLYSPTLVDSSTPVVPLLGASATLLSLSIVEDHIILPLMAASFDLLSPTLTSGYSSSSSAVTGVTQPTFRAPNPYSPKEVRHAIQAANQNVNVQSGIIATINTTLSIVQSAISDLDGRIDVIEGAVGNSYSAETDDATSIGQPIYVKSNTHIGLAKADAAGTMKVAGLAITAVSATFTALYNADGRLSLADWTAITGSATLTPGAYYYLDDATPGMMTTTAPTTTGKYVVRLGRAISTVIFDIEVEQSILL